MSTSASLYLNTAAQFEGKARKAADPSTKSAYEDLARAYREVAKVVDDPSNSSTELDGIAERMVAHTSKTAA